MSKYHSKETLMIDSLTLLVKDIDVSVKFYSEILGLSITKIDDSHYELGTGERILFTIKTNDNVIPKTKTTGLYHFALLLPKRSDLGNLLYNFLVNDTVIQGGSDHGVSEAVYLQDPDNNGIEIYVDKEDANWPLSGDDVNMVSIPLDYEDIINNRTSNNLFVMPQDTIIGHMHFHVNDLNLASNFFINIIGFELRQNMHSALFVSDQKYHHHLGFNVWNGINIIDRLENMAGLVSYHLNVNDQNKFIENLENHSILINSDELGKYIIDVNNVKVYF